MAGRAASTVRRSLALGALIAILAMRAAWSQADAATAPATDTSSLFAAYAVVSVRPAGPDARVRCDVCETPDGINAEATTVSMLSHGAYGGGPGDVAPDDAIIGWPDWAKSSYFTIKAKMSAEQMASFAQLSKVDQLQRRTAMLQALLADRFNLRVHHITRQVPAYELLVAKGGPKFKEGDTNPDMATIHMAQQLKGKAVMMMTMAPQGAEKVIAQQYQLAGLATFLMHLQDVNHTVIDKTGLTGKYSFTLTFAANGGVGPARTATDSTAPDPVPTIFQALEDQLGLRLQRGTATVDTVVVDHVEKPAAD